MGDRPDRSSDLANHVLGHFESEDAKIMEQAMEKAADAAMCFLTEGADLAMNRYNTPKEKKPKKPADPDSTTAD